MIYDLIIIGSGPAGYVAAIRAGQTGLKTLVIDKKYVGGMCLNWGCIPTKSIIESAKLFKRIKIDAAEFGISGFDANSLSFDWQQAVKRSAGIVSKLSKGIEYLWKKSGVEFLQAEAKIISANEVEADKRIFSAKHIIIASGSKPKRQEMFPEAIELEDFFQLSNLPEKPLLYGRGATILEFAQFFAMLGKKPTIISSALPLIPKLDGYLDTYIMRKLKKDKIPIYPQNEVRLDKAGLHHGDSIIEYDAVINCSLREAVFIDSDIPIDHEDAYIKTNARYQTNIPNIFAAGDVNGISYMAHAASAQGNSIVDFINGVENDTFPPYPINIYSEPEIAQLGLTEQELKTQKIEYQIKEMSLNANGKALAEGASEGFIRLLFETKYRQVLGVQIVAVNATDLISEAGVLMELEGTVFDLARTVHAHPTVAEVFMDVAKD
ncbi:MAG: FAD-dependent oxidoreductase [Candidatus Cloacimonetes bacterium]|nr:FAD-dependent oxidoreductase [Candidatus Cloacimonadota bacterium]